jgi:hypothetical protein
MNIRRTTRLLAVTTVAAGTMLAGAFAPAFASDGTSATVTGGSLTIDNAVAGDFAARSITGVAQSTTASLGAFSVADLTGTGAGWNVTAQASQFDNGDHDLATGSLTMSAPTVASPDTLSADPSITAGPYTIDAGSAVKIASAAVDTGMGEYDFSATTLTLALPADVYAGTYTSTVTISVISAP